MVYFVSDFVGFLNEPNNSHSYKLGYGPYVDGTLNWAVNVQSGMEKRSLVVGFDLRVEEFIYVPQPEYGIEDHKDYNINVGLLDGKLCIIKKLAWYDLRSKNLEDVRIRGTESDFDVHVCHRSLVSLNVGDGSNRKKQPSNQKPAEKNKKKRDDFLSTGFKLKL
ncbi:F-box protein CPR30-like [Quillaja saponaria]|uniref:F-box protein CPR30-like n=1 Tax=Quillaja saponaria TaxID=32244 RepID=A0AAD7M0Q0_QUISA|nr:F-box protein CPR30-like [Quillaja saponaria]